ncbi:hypothetical protein IPH25_00245 [bacterium]|nr:MAG: hypothetical protein IPG37_02360 [bacterium]QQR61864.1 MAG: hypothetical protein IPH25_00245 [bacterium]
MQDAFDAENINRKLWVLYFVLFFSFAVIIYRLVYLQLLNNEELLIRSHKNFLRLATILPDRGDIVDCKGTVIATNKPFYVLSWKSVYKKVLTYDQVLELQRVAAILELSKSEEQELLAHISRASKLQQIYSFSKPLTSKQVHMIKEIFPAHENIFIQTLYQRYYPYSTVASHLIGYVAKGAENVEGKIGLEKLCNDSLKGSAGTILKSIDSAGSAIQTTLLRQSLHGNSVVATVDMNLQLISEQVFLHEFIGAMIIFDPHTGAVKALVSRPTFDPTVFLNPIAQKAWDALQVKDTFVNRALVPYPPGSIFKLVTMCAALETGIIEPDSSWHCKGYTVFGKRKYFCARRRGHGTLSLKEAVAYSCNTLFFEIAKKLDIDVLADYAKRFGFGQKTGFLLYEQHGLVPNRNWKREIKGQPWWPGETLSAAIGQTFLLASPLQVACFIGSIFTKKLYRPRILENEPISSRDVDIQDSTLHFLKKSMKSVVRRGTGKGIPAIKDLQIYAKTSTAQISSLKKAEFNKNYSEHGWFAAYFTYKDQAPLVLVLLVEKAGTSRVPISIAKQFFLRYRSFMHRSDK